MIINKYPLLDVFSAYFNYQVKFSNLFRFFEKDPIVKLKEIKEEFQKIVKKYGIFMNDKRVPRISTLKSITSKGYRFWQADFYDEKNSIFIELELNTEKSASAWVNAIGQTFMYIADSNFRHATYIIFVIDRVIKHELNENDRYLLDFLTQIGIYCYTIYQDEYGKIKSYTTIPDSLYYQK